MDTSELAEMMRALLEAHGLPSELYKGWLLPHGSLPAVRLVWFPDAAARASCLDLEVLLPDRRRLVESFAGAGHGPEALTEAVTSLCSNTLPVLLSALWGVPAPDQVTVEEWEISGVRREVYIGPLGLRRPQGADDPVPAGLFPGIERAIRSETLSPAHHWSRTYAGHVPGRASTFEALLDNEDWPAGVAALRSVPWTERPYWYSVRNFLLVQASPSWGTSE